MKTIIKIIAVIMCGILVGGLIFGLTNLSDSKSSNIGSETTTHTHSYSSKYSYDTIEHWRVASCGHDLVTEQEAHDFGDGDTCKCGYKKPQESEDGDHVHSYSSTYCYNTVQHWKVAICGHDLVTEQEAHDFGSGDTCKCGYKKPQESEDGDHVHAYSSTYCYNTVQHWKVAICGHDLVTEQEAHDFGEDNTCKCGFTTTSDVSSMKAIYHMSSQQLSDPSEEAATEEQIEQFNKALKQCSSTQAIFDVTPDAKGIPVMLHVLSLCKIYYYGIYLSSENVLSTMKVEYTDDNYVLTMVSISSVITAYNTLFMIEETYTPYEELAKFMNMVFGVTYEVVYVADNLEEFPF